MGSHTKPFLMWIWLSCPLSFERGVASSKYIEKRDVWPASQMVVKEVLASVGALRQESSLETTETRGSDHSHSFP